MFVSAIVVAAGFGLRLNSSIPKPLVRLRDKPIFLYSLSILDSHPEIREIILVVSRGNLSKFERCLKKRPLEKIKKLVFGGARRTDSVKSGLRYVSKNSDFVLIHDACRPFIDSAMVSRLTRETRDSGAAVLGIPLKATIKELDKRGYVRRTLRRENLYEIQTPQVFAKDLILKAYKKRLRRSYVTDDAMLIEKLGLKVKVIPGSYFNIKITTPEDLVFAEAILKNQKSDNIFQRKAQNVKRKTKT
ncbi:MAG: 2-C-methyl-D-erythritol 4-phosphate cytidylyltransferase [Candidatus Omnitrophica bacterium]|nr:2-C-methyl-D-erythritol 4-phosphate cytidylyltransferase [Candidatus Omnitrophota bacterium]